MAYYYLHRMVKVSILREMCWSLRNFIHEWVVVFLLHHCNWNLCTYYMSLLSKCLWCADRSKRIAKQTRVSFFTWLILTLILGFWELQYDYVNKTLGVKWHFSTSFDASLHCSPTFYCFLGMLPRDLVE